MHVVNTSFTINNIIVIVYMLYGICIYIYYKLYTMYYILCNAVFINSYQYFVYIYITLLLDI